MIGTHVSWQKAFAICGIAGAALFLALLVAPHQAHAAIRVLTTATSTSNNASTTVAKVGDTVLFQLNLDGGVSATNTPMISVLNMGTTTMTGSAGASAWTYSTTSVSGWSNGSVTFTMAWMGSVAEATSTFASAGSSTLVHVRFDKTVPTISDITSNATAAGALKVGDTIVFTLTPGATEYGATVSGSYNSQSLTWSTADSGVTFTATYTVAEGETDRTSALQISSVVITDAAGNASSAGAGTDVVKTIDANTPATPTSNVGAGTYESSQMVALTSTGSNSVYYTTDSSTPSCTTGTLYASSFTIAATVKAIGCDTAGNASAVATFTYTVTTPAGGSGGGGGGGYIGTSQPPTPASVLTRMTENQIQSILSLLTSFGADQAVIDNVNAALHGQKTSPAPGTAPVVALTRNLSLGSTGADVKALQVFLNTHGFAVASAGPGSPGNETTTFGGLTRAALAKFQKAKGITPAVGYFGPITRAAISGM